MITEAPFAVGHRNPALRKQVQVDGPESLQYDNLVSGAGHAVVRASAAVGAGGGSKRVRRERAKEARVSVFRYRSVWLAPFLAETVLLLAAIWLTVCLHRIVWTPGSHFPVLSFVLLAAVHVGLAGYARLHELFMPRAVVTLGVGGLVLIAAVAGVSVTLDAFLLGGQRRVLTACLVLIPIALFLARCALSFRDARYAPRLTERTLAANVGSRRLRDLREKLRFWLS